MRLHFRILPPLGLLALSIVVPTLVGIIGLELREGAPDEAPVPVQLVRQQQLSLSAPAFHDRPKNQNDPYVTTILARPLFSPIRHPPAPAPVPEQAAPGLARLSGVIVSPAGKSAIFAGPQNDKSIVAGEGTHVGEYFVRSITAGAVTVIGPSGELVLHPAFDPNLPRKIETVQPTADPNPLQKHQIPEALVAQFQRALHDYSRQSRNQSPHQ